MSRPARKKTCDKRESCEHGHALHGPAPCPACGKLERGLDSAASPLEVGTRERMQSRFGFDFGNVRVHDGADAKLAANAVDARAFTVGRDVVLGEEPSPGSRQRERILAHELAHVVQQGGKDARHSPFPLGRADDPREAEADRAARSVQSGARARVAPQTAGALLQREEKKSPEPEMPKDDDFSGCKDGDKKIIQEASNDARTWVVDAHKAVREVKSGSAKKEVKETFANFYRFDPSLPESSELMGKVESSWSKMESGVGKKLSFVCANRTAGKAASVETGFFSCDGQVTIYDDFFEKPDPGFETDATELADIRDQRARVLVHELAHKFAGREGEVRPGKTPQAFGCERQWPKWGELGANDAVNNADTYALFAQTIQKKK